MARLCEGKRYHKARQETIEWLRGQAHFYENQPRSCMRTILNPPENSPHWLKDLPLGTTSYSYHHLNTPHLRPLTLWRRYHIQTIGHPYPWLNYCSQKMSFFNCPDMGDKPIPVIFHHEQAMSET
jgi:hypothetical protein